MECGTYYTLEACDMPDLVMGTKKWLCVLAQLCDYW